MWDQSCFGEQPPERNIETHFHIPRNKGRKEGNVLFNDALSTFYLRLYMASVMWQRTSQRKRKPAAATWATLSD